MIRLAVRVTREHAELVLAELLELAPTGVEEVDHGEVIEYAVYGAPGELPTLPALQAAAGGALVDVISEEIADDWTERWREFHRPLVIPGRLTVRPPWEPPGETPVDVVIDPSRAFGTGAHATTRLCLELLLELEPDGPLIDLGCGSGVLGIVAAKLGWAPVTGLDNDPDSLETAPENARVNHVHLGIGRLDLRIEPVPAAPGTTILANLLAPLLIDWASAVPNGASRVLASGIIVSECDRVAEAFARVGFTERARRVSGEWGALLLERV